MFLIDFFGSYYLRKGIGMTEKKMISVIVPVYNEELVLPLFLARMTQVMDGLKDYDWKVIFINDGSRDNSWKIIQNISDGSAIQRGVSFSELWPPSLYFLWL